MTVESIKAFTKRGGKIHKLPGFEYKPLPRADQRQQKARPGKRKRPALSLLR